MLFDAASRVELKESAGYESYVCHQAVEIEQLKSGQVSPLRFTIEDEKEVSLHLGIMTEFSGGAKAAVLQVFSPLLFVTAFKPLDAYVEWVLEENGRTFEHNFWSFVEKATELGRGTLTRPDYLATEPALARVIDEIFKKLIEKRNALIHGDWGHAVGGDLQFDFVNKAGMTVKETMPFFQVVALADFAGILLDSVTSPPAKTEEVIETLKFLADKLDSIHGLARFNVKAPRLFDVVRNTVQDEIDLDFIRSEIEVQAQGKPYRYNLLIRHQPTSGEWKTTGEKVKGRSTLKISELQAGSI